MKYTYGNITDLAVYNTKYFHPNSTKIIQIKFGLCKEVAVNAIICIPTLKQLKASISFEGNFNNSPLVQTYFPLIYKPSKTGLPFSVEFYYKEFI